MTSITGTARACDLPIIVNYVIDLARTLADLSPPAPGTAVSASRVALASQPFSLSMAFTLGCVRLYGF
jgi:hypothetical protein